VRSFYKGFAPAVVVVVPRRAVKFFLFEQIRTILWAGKQEDCPLQLNMLSGGLAGAIEAALITPFEVVKISQQAERGTTQRGTFQCLRSIASSGGIPAFYKGLSATVCKHFFHSCVYFMAYQEAKKNIPSRTDWRVAYTLGAGFLAGSCAAVVNNPFDVVKSRLQITASSAHLSMGQEFANKYSTTAQTFLRIWRSEGPRALYQGFSAKILRLGPGSALIFLIYEEVMAVLLGNGRGDDAR
jgi:solute carrier family 25 2-oxodicarboxylate transporter 21